MRHAARARGRPVFLDRSGRRRRLVLLAGLCLGAVLIGSLALLGVGLSGASPIHIPGFPDSGAHAGGPSPEPSDPSSGGREPGTAAQPYPTTTPGPAASPSTEPTSPRRIPTHTPSHQPKPSKTK